LNGVFSFTYLYTTIKLELRNLRLENWYPNPSVRLWFDEQPKGNNCKQLSLTNQYSDEEISSLLTLFGNLSANPRACETIVIPLLALPTGLRFFGTAVHVLPQRTVPPASPAK